MLNVIVTVIAFHFSTKSGIFKDFKSMSSLVHLPRPPVEEGAGAAVPVLPVPVLGMCAGEATCPIGFYILI